MGRGYGREWGGYFVILISSIFVSGYYLQHANCLSLADKEQVIMSPAFSSHASRKQGQIKAAPVVTWLVHLLGYWCRVASGLYSFWANLQILFSKKPFEISGSSFISAVRTKFNPRQSQDHWALEDGCFFVTSLFVTFSNHCLISKLYHKNHIASMIFSLMLYFTYLSVYFYILFLIILKHIIKASKSSTCKISVIPKICVSIFYDLLVQLPRQIQLVLKVLQKRPVFPDYF